MRVLHRGDSGAIDSERVTSDFRVSVYAVSSEHAMHTSQLFSVLLASYYHYILYVVVSLPIIQLDFNLNGANYDLHLCGH